MQLLSSKTMSAFKPRQAKWSIPHFITKPTSCTQPGSSPHFSYFRNLAKKKKRRREENQASADHILSHRNFHKQGTNFQLAFLLKPFKLELQGLWENEGCDKSACTAISYLVAPTVHCFIVCICICCFHTVLHT